jgi:hypothetical protein
MGKRVDEAKYAQIKAFLGEPYNTKTSILSEMFKLSLTTVGYIKKSASFEDYRKICSNSFGIGKKITASAEQPQEFSRREWIPYLSYTFVFKWGSSFKQEKVFITVNAQSSTLARPKAARIFKADFSEVNVTQELNSIKDPSRG